MFKLFKKCFLIVLVVSLGLGVLISSGATLFQTSLPKISPRPKTVALYHGPNPLTKLSPAQPEVVLGKNTIRPQQQTKRPTTQKTSPNSSSNLTVVVGQPSKVFGISAGGDLIYLNQTDLNNYFSAIKSLGAKWVRWDIDWGAIQEYNSLLFDWSGTDRVATTAKNYGITSIGTVAFTPKWAADPTCNADFGCEPADPKAFGHFAGVAAQRYKGLINYWEIWNEPNYPSFWRPAPDARRYEGVLKEAYTEIKRVNPEAFVMSAGLAASGDESDGSISPQTFIGDIYTSGFNKYFDAVALHPYSFPVSPDYKASWNSWQRMEPVHQIMENGGDGNKKIWITEYGAPTGGPGVVRNLNDLIFNHGSDYMSESAQQSTLQQAATLYTQNTDWLGGFFWYSLHDNGNTRDTPENFFGLLRYDWSKKPAYDTFRNIILANP